ncbi:MAG: histidine--tRNA ligase [Vulcanimicrobiaceae bacterium]
MSTKITAPRGTQDLIPPLSGRWQELEARIHSLARSYGYGEIRTPIFEATDLFVRGVGETTDIVEKEMYTFLDKGERSMTLRPEWTAPVMRAALQHNLLTLGAQRLYYIGPIFRYERPQAGRYRQAHQFGVECIGYHGPEADVEVIALAWDLMQAYGLPDVVLNINSIGDDACRPKYREALLAHFRPHVQSLSQDSQRRLERNPLRLLDSKAPEDKPYVDSAPTFEDVLCNECRAHFDAVKRYLIEAGIPFVVNPRIVRGLDYYTRTVFEFISGALGAQSTVCAGGRYDNLVKSLGGPDVPAVGFGLGLERFLMIVEATGAANQTERRGVQAVALGPEARERLVPLVVQLRRESKVPVFMDYEDRKVTTQLKIADRNNARYALILGSNELASGTIVLRDLVSRSDRTLPLRSGKDVAAALVEVER